MREAFFRSFIHSSRPSSPFRARTSLFYPLSSRSFFAAVRSLVLILCSFFLQVGKKKALAMTSDLPAYPAGDDAEQCGLGEEPGGDQLQEVRDAQG